MGLVREGRAEPLPQHADQQVADDERGRQDLEAVKELVDLCNEQWLLEKNGFLSPSAIWAAWYAGQAPGVSA